MKNTPKLVHISEPLWRALEVMSEQMGVDKDALVNQAVYALARMHGFITPPQVKVNDDDAHALDPLLPEPMPSVKPGPPVATPPEPPPTVPERGPMPSPPTMAMPAPTMSAPPMPPPPVAAPPAAAAAANAKADAPQGPSETERTELRAKATETMKAIAAEVERIVAVQADAPIGEDAGDEDEDEDEQDDASEAESEEVQSPAEEQHAAAAEDEEGDDDASEAPSEQTAAIGEDADEPDDEAAAAAPNGQAELESDLESLGLGEGEDPKSDLSPLPELAEEDAPRDEPEGIPTALVRPNDAIGSAATSLRPKHKKGDDSAGMATMGVHVNVPDRPDGAEEINVTGTVRRLALQIRGDREEEEPQERTQIVRKEEPRLFIVRGGADPVEIVSERYLIGRGPHCDLVIESNRVSREHAAVFNDDEDGFVVEDLGSSNGTWFKEERVQKHVISDGDEVFFGNEAVRFNLQAPGAGAKRGARRDGRVQA